MQLCIPLYTKCRSIIYIKDEKMLNLYYKILIQTLWGTHLNGWQENLEIRQVNLADAASIVENLRSSENCDMVENANEIKLN